MMSELGLILYSYRRPQQTFEAIERLLNWKNIGTLYISIDGLRYSASSEELVWRQETIRIAEQAAENNPNIIPVIWEKNEGLTAHSIRIMSKVFQQHKGVFSLEEDNLIENDGLEFLNRALGDACNPAIATAFSTQIHLNDQREFRETLFPEQWATSLTYHLFEEFLQVWHDKKIDRNLISNQFRRIYPLDLMKREIVTERWFRIFKLAVNDLSYGDAVMNYAGLKKGIPYKAPLKSFVQDLGSVNNRGLHPRNGSVDFDEHEFEPVSKKSLLFCKVCENNTNQVSGNGLGTVAKYISKRYFPLGK
jgi:hypothetical protein